MENLKKLMYWHGIKESYYNYKGEHIVVNWENRLALLEAMGVDVNDSQLVEQKAYKLDIEPWTSWLSSLLVAYEAAEGVFISINVNPDELKTLFEYTIRTESGDVFSGDFTPEAAEEVGDYIHNDRRFSRRNIRLPCLPVGYHSLTLTANGDACEAVLAVSPQKAFVPYAYRDQKNRHPWGIIIQLYTLRSETNWGIGDFSDLKYLIERLAELGCDAIGLNPLHALKHPIKHNFSPYSPSDRRYLNPLYIDPSREIEFGLIQRDFEPDKAALRMMDKVFYEGVARLKFSTYQSLYALFKEQAHEQRKMQFEHFKSQKGQPLIDYCLFQVLDESGHFHQFDNGTDKQSLLVQHAESVDFHAYLQWVAEKQLDECQQLCEDKGMSIGLIRDLAVGANGGGAEVQTSDGLFCADAAVGAPPDPMAELGQNWGLPPMDPATLRQTNYTHYVGLLRENMRACGALRIDHAMSLFRLWWCPPGKTADFGAYVHYPFHEMLGILKLESIRNQCLLVGEDMGVVPPELRQALIEGDILTNKLFYFEKNPDGSFKLPSEYDEQAMSMLTNHDVPTLASWWLGSDLKLRDSINQLEKGVNLEQTLVQRHAEKLKLLEWLDTQGFDWGTDAEQLCSKPLSQSLVQQIIVASSRCRSQLFVLQLEDLELMEAPVNVPGTSNEYPNWQRKVSRNLEQIFADNFAINTLKMVAQERSRLADANE